jgi:putative inorganic carbon (HCO3(-)) transporter
MTAEALAQAGGVVAASGLALVVLGERRTWRLAGLAIWTLGLALFLPLLAPSEQREVLAAAAVVGVIGAGALAFLFVRRPWALPILALAAAPVRIPVTIGDTSANLLLPLYGVVAAAALALAWGIWREPRRPRELGFLAWPFALLVLWFGLSGLWTDDVRNGGITLFFYVLPFGVLAVALARLRWSPSGMGRLYAVLLAMALVFAAIGIWQWATRDIFWNPKVIVGNAYAPFYRVNSVFWDPSIYGRFLVVAILSSLVLLLVRTRRGPVFDLAVGGAIVLAWVGLLFSFSQSSFVALAAGIVLTAALVWRWRALAVVAVAALVMIPVGIASPQLENVRDTLGGSSSSGLSRVTSDRSKLVVVGLRIAEDHPIAGVGIGGFKRAYGERVARSSAPRDAASHTTPVTVVAETGVVGLALFAWLLAAALGIAFRRNGDASAPAAKTALVAGVVLAAIFVHSLFYNAFFEDPFTWGLLAIVALVASARPTEAA